MAGVSNPAIVDNLLTRIADSAVWYVLGAGLGIYLFARGFGLLRQKRLILNIPRSTIRGAAVGLIEVSGKVVGPYTLIAPLSEEECFYYRSVARLSGNSPGGSGGKSLAEETLCAPFFLDDGTGRLLIDLHRADMQLIPLLHDESSQSPNPNYMRGFLERHGISTEYRVTLEEYCIRPGDTLFALGTLQENSAEEIAESSPGTSRHEDARFLSEAAADLQRRAALAFELPGMETARLNPRVSANPYRSTKSGEFDLHPRVVLTNGRTGDPYLISWRSQRDVVQELAGKTILYVWGGPILTLACVWVLVRRFFGQ
jgi:E3 Ubiquitin ligase